MQQSSRSTPARHKPQDVTGWLGFTLPSRHQTGFSAPPRRSKKGEGARFNAFNKEKYVNARYRFVMKPTGSYSAHFADPDIFLHWPNILQVIVPTVPMLSLVEGEVGEDDAIKRMRRESEEEGQTCPICLGNPVAGRMTKCGHIFCFPCILHYIQLSDIPKSTKCPICGDTVLERMLKSVCYHEPTASATLLESEPSSSKQPHTLQMTLMHRPKITTLALPLSSTWPSEALPYHSAPFHFAPDALDFSKFVLATPEYMLAELERELEELRQEWRLLDGDDLGRSFVGAAEVKVRKQVEKVREELDLESVRLLEREAMEGLDAVMRRREREEERDRQRADRAAKAAEELEAPPAPDNIPTEMLAISQHPSYDHPSPSPSKQRPKRKPHANAPPQPLEPSYHFYQSSLGANIFLHPLDIRILLAHYKHDSLFPHTLTVTPTDADPGTMNEDLGRRCKYLSHLPAGTDLIFVETDLEQLVSKETLAQFEQPLKTRRSKRRDKVRKEDRAKSRWEASERLKLPFDAQMMSRDDDADFALALARSTLDDGFVGGASSTASTSPTTPQVILAASPPSAPTWASRAISNVPMRRIEAEVESWEVEQAWEALEQAEGRRGGDGGGGGGGGKKNKKKNTTLVLGGGGGRGR